MDARRPSHGSIVIPEDGIFITDRGIGKRSEAFHWLMMGCHVYDHEFCELTVQDLEQNIDPNGAMNPVCVRGALWKTVPQRFWLASRGGRNGPEPAQPGLDSETSGETLYQREILATNDKVKYYGLGQSGISEEGRLINGTDLDIRVSRSTRSPSHNQSQSLGTWPPISPELSNRQTQPTSPLSDRSITPLNFRSGVRGTFSSMASMSGESLQSSNVYRRSRSASTESIFTSQDKAIIRNPQDTWRRMCWKMEEVVSEERTLNQGDIVRGTVVGKESRTRLDSFLASRPFSSEGIGRKA